MMLPSEPALVWLRACLRALRRLKGVRGVQVVAAFKILTSDPQVKALLVNIFGAALPLLHTWTRPHNTQNCSVHGALTRSSPYQQVLCSSCLTSKVMNRLEAGESSLSAQRADARSLWVRRRHHEVRRHRGRHCRCSKRGQALSHLWCVMYIFVRHFIPLPCSPALCQTHAHSCQDRFESAG